MPERRNAIITMSNLGPIRRARIEIKPLNVFIGGHNTGKSYAAQMTYLIGRVLQGQYRKASMLESAKPRTRKARQELNALALQLERGKEIRFSQLGESLRDTMEIWWAGLTESSKSEMISAVNQYFMADSVSDLVMFGSDVTRCTIAFSAAGKDGPKMGIRMQKRPARMKVQIQAPSIQELTIRPGVLPWDVDYDYLRVGMIIGWRNAWKGIADHESFYLPAARSGLLQVWPMLQLYVMDMLPEKMGLPGLVKDFFADMAKSGIRLRDARKDRKPITQALQILESEILGGKIAYRRQRPGPSIVDYIFTEGASISIQRASSMVAELAPLGLWIDRLLDKGDLLIIEEPEAHLHPSTQIQVARLIVRLANAGIRVICTTHSQLLVNRISNLMLASKTRESVRASLGLEDIDLINEEDVAVYQFLQTDSGSVVKRLRMISRFGIPEDEFLREYEKISIESYRVSG